MSDLKLPQPDQNAIPETPTLRWPELTCRELIRLLPIVAGDYRIVGPPLDAIRAEIRKHEFLVGEAARR
jgi:hypothetical protein